MVVVGRCRTAKRGDRLRNEWPTILALFNARVLDAAVLLNQTRREMAQGVVVSSLWPMNYHEAPAKAADEWFGLLSSRPRCSKNVEAHERMMLRTKPVLAVALFSMLLWTPALPAAPPEEKHKLAATSLVDVDADFAFQGEYLGRMPGRGFRRSSLGLQVIAMGDGAFTAVLLTGGLPGAGWDRTTRHALAGNRKEGVVTLASTQWSASVHDGHATIHDSGGGVVTVLNKIHRVSTTLGARPAAGATVLFDGTGVEHWQDAKVTEDGLLMAGVMTQMPVQDFYLHLEFRTPYMPYARGQARANSGVYIQRRYEVQILDSFGLKGVHNECGGLYRQQEPDVNMCLPPLSWQTYDIQFTAAQWNAAGEKTANARLTVLHNGEPIHRNRELSNKTGAGKPEGPEPLPIYLQDHGNPVQFRNIWLSVDPVITLPVQRCRLLRWGLLRRR